GVRPGRRPRPEASPRRLRALDLVDEGAAPLAPVALLPERRRAGHAPDGARRGRRALGQLADRAARDDAAGPARAAPTRSARTDGRRDLRRRTRIPRLAGRSRARGRSAGAARRDDSPRRRRSGAVLQRRRGGPVPLSPRPPRTGWSSRGPAAGGSDVTFGELLARDRRADRRLSAPQALRQRRDLRPQRHRSAPGPAPPRRHAAMAGGAVAEDRLQRQDGVVAA